MLSVSPPIYFHRHSFPAFPFISFSFHIFPFFLVFFFLSSFYSFLLFSRDSRSSHNTVLHFSLPFSNGYLMSKRTMDEKTVKLSGFPREPRIHAALMLSFHFFFAVFPSFSFFFPSFLICVHASL